MLFLILCQRLIPSSNLYRNRSQGTGPYGVSTKQSMSGRSKSIGKVMKKQNEIWDQLEKNGATAGQSGGEKRSATIPQVDDHHRGERSSKDLGDNEEQEDTEAEIARYKAREKAYLQDDSKGSRTKSRRRHWEDQNRLHLNAKGEREGSPGSSHRHSHETTSSQNYAAPPASMTFSNITGAGISVGGGDVRVFNEHSGNKI
ncbi:hypothetical protein BDZ97DRAFT_188729 [Flammula alnicola]|nr:hypothetical protein BDZ97DRAFT_188729 [Flammula alnicola]